MVSALPASKSRRKPEAVASDKKGARSPAADQAFHRLRSYSDESSALRAIIALPAHLSLHGVLLARQAKVRQIQNMGLGLTRIGWNPSQELGFDLCGVVSADKSLNSNTRRVARTRIRRGDEISLGSASTHIRRSVPGIRSVVVCALNYNTSLPKSTDVPHLPADNEPHGWISRYAWGDELHEVLKGRLDEHSQPYGKHLGEIVRRSRLCDTGPLHERIFAKYAASAGWARHSTFESRPGFVLFLEQSLPL